MKAYFLLGIILIASVPEVYAQGQIRESDLNKKIRLRFTVSLSPSAMAYNGSYRVDYFTYEYTSDNGYGVGIGYEYPVSKTILFQSGFEYMELSWREIPDGSPLNLEVQNFMVGLGLRLGKEEVKFLEPSVNMGFNISKISVDYRYRGDDVQDEAPGWGLYFGIGTMVNISGRSAVRLDFLANSFTSRLEDNGILGTGDFVSVYRVYGLIKVSYVLKI